MTGLTDLLSDRVAVVTGGGRGLGLGIAETLLASGATVVLADREPDLLAAAQAKLSGLGTVSTSLTDVTESESMAALVAETVERHGSLDIFVNNAGILRDATMRKMSEADFDAVIDVNLKGCWLGTRAAAAAMREKEIRGSIINMSSISGKVGNPGQTNYSAAKAGIVGLTKAAAKELGRYGIRVNAVAPGLLDTEMIRAMRPEVLESRLQEIPLGRLGSVGEVATAVLFLASDLSSYMTGTVLEIAGGRHI